MTSLADSNLAGIGSDEDRAARKAAAATEACYAGAGAGPGLKIWRVENKRTENDTPDFGIAHWPEAEYGNFFTGDSYVVLNTYKKEGSDALLHDVHFWLGEESTQDEIGVAAYKAVELDDLLDDVPVQHREVMGHESGLFQGYFPEMRFLQGGVASGFRSAEPEVYEPRLLHVVKTRRTVRATQVPVSVSSLDHGDVFVLDTGLKIYLWAGDAASPFEKAKGAQLQHNIITARHGKPSKGDAEDDDFWAALGGTAADVKPAVERESEPEIKTESCRLFKLSDASGALEFSEVSGGTALSHDMLDEDDVFVVNGSGVEVFCWVGSKASAAEKRHAMKYAEAFLEKESLPSWTPITCVKSGQTSASFASCFAA